MILVDHDRPRERLLSAGPAALSDAELLALVLGTGGRGEDATALARRLLARVGGLAGLGAADPAEMACVAGVGPARAAQLRAVGEIAVRAATVPLREGDRLGTSEQVFAAYGPRLAHERREMFLAVALDAKHRVIGETCVATGHLMGVEVHPREVFRPLVRAAAAAAVLLHNHPSGDPTPSPEDRLLTRRLVGASFVMGIELVDHVVIGRGRWASLRAEGGLVLDTPVPPAQHGGGACERTDRS